MAPTIGFWLRQLSPVVDLAGLGREDGPRLVATRLHPIRQPISPQLSRLERHREGGWVQGAGRGGLGAAESRETGHLSPPQKTPAILNMYWMDIGLWKLMEIVKNTR